MSKKDKSKVRNSTIKMSKQWKTILANARINGTDAGLKAIIVDIHESAGVAKVDLDKRWSRGAKKEQE
jgi:hypothetical protein